MDINSNNIVSIKDIEDAYLNIKSHNIKFTECSLSEKLSEEFQMQIYLKHEYRQVTGSYKERGAVNFLLNIDNVHHKSGVVTASAGNHGLALSYHGNKLSIPIIVCVPLTAPAVKVDNCKKNGAKIIFHGKDFEEAKNFAMKYSDDNNLIYANGFDNPHVIAGQGTVMMEIIEQVDNIDALIVPVGGGGLIAGIATIAKHINPNCIIVGVEPKLCSSMNEALSLMKPIKVSSSTHLSIADGLCVSVVGENTLNILSPLVNRMIQVEEKHIFSAILKLMEYEKCVVEGAGAAGIAALISGELDFLKGKKVVIILCGSNIDSNILTKAMDRALFQDGRITNISVCISDRPGGLLELVQFFHKQQTIIRDISFERVSQSNSVFLSKVNLCLEFQSASHSFDVRKQLKKLYGDLI